MSTAAPPTRDQLAPLSTPDLIARFRIGVERFDRRLLQLDDAQLDMAFLPDAGVGRWPCRVLVGHLADAELAFVHRLRKVVAEERPILQPWDEQAFIDAGLYGDARGGAQFPVGGFVAAIHTLRRWTGEWLATLTPEQFAREGLHPERGVQSVRVILEYDTWHLEHHAWYLNRKIERMLGPA